MNVWFSRVPRAAGVLALLCGLSACSGGGGDPGVVVPDPLVPAPSGSLPDLGLDPAAPPSRNFDLKHWKLTLPSGKEIQAAALNDGYTLSKVFFTDPASGGMVFRCPNLAGTTANSHYSRTELREMLRPDGSASADANNWTTSRGGTLRARLRVDRVSKTGDDKKVGRVIIGQIHGEGAEVVRLYYHKLPNEAKGRIYARMDSADNSRDQQSADIVGNEDGDGIALGDLFSYEIRLAGLTLTVRIEPAKGAAVTYVKTIDEAYSGTRLYFKAGVYNQNNTGTADDYAQATFIALTQDH